MTMIEQTLRELLEDKVDLDIEGIDRIYPTDEDPPDGAMYLVTDGYSGSNSLPQMPSILGHAGCWVGACEKEVCGGDP